MRIREYDERDRDGLRQCVIELQEFERDLDPRKPRGADLADTLVDQTFEDCRRYRGKVFVADEQGDLVGYVCVWGRAPSETIQDALGEFALVTDLVVRADHRNRGVGGSLLGRAEAYALTCGADWLRVSVLARNRGARSLYAGQGFEDYEMVLEKELRAAPRRWRRRHR
jgi:GNAT superfamily N-acetyltransferase